MRRIAHVIFLPVAAALLTSCSTYRAEGEPTAAELAAIRQSQNTAPENYRGDVVAYMRNYLNDPTGVRSAAISPPVLKSLATGSRYISCMRYDAKKANGQYAGTKTALIVFISGRLDRVIEPPAAREGRDTPDTVEIRETCKDAAYGAFPELQAMRR